MNNKLFFKGLIAMVLITACSQFASAQDSIKKEAVVKPVYKPKAVITQPAGAKPAIPQPATTAPAKPYTPAPAPVEPNDRSIKGQYQFLLNKTYGYQKPLLSAFYKSVTDTLGFERKKIKPLETSVAVLKDTIKSLHNQLTSQQQVVNESTTKVDNISLAGINMTKSAYNTLMWGLVIAFGAAAAFVIIRSGSYSREAKYRIKLYEDLDEEYKGYKAKANEKEKKLARELQTARNKLEELTGNPGY
ncbi:hypothetical protein [Mucilaginibacter polytrichastri]|uniref:Uncharacterized protein n=1 Tax=Mucilaginibacter polytrichastri TaxID=1302689 RepID=A0A1Q5ZSE2_9SPHI|nr:hypothetical protein [Mucilaginibacter polytrichastri]OKS84685.1 hypothetical protein RG47T_0118 [Mucilaginibacter polytrichastri]